MFMMLFLYPQQAQNQGHLRGLLWFLLELLMADYIITLDDQPDFSTPKYNIDVN